MLAEITFFTLPLLLSGLVHHALVIPRDHLSFLRAPVDFGLKIGDKRVLGDAKTWRGFFIMMVLTALTSYSLNFYLDIYTPIVSFLVGAGMGLGYSAGEIPNSFLKRRLDITPSARGKGGQKILFDIIDHTDSIIGSLIVVIFTYPATLRLLILLFLIGSGAHFLGDLALRKYSYKRRLS